jgi:subtilisin
MPQRGRQLLLIWIVLAALAAPAHAADKDPPPTSASTSDRYVVTYHAAGSDGVPAGRVDTETSARERALGFESELSFKRAVRGFAARLSDADVQALEADPEVALVAPDREVHALDAVPVAAGDSVPFGVRRLEAATTAQAHAASSVNVAVIDTGVDLDHPDLVVANGINCAGSGPADDDHGHGTHVAGTVAARSNGTGVVGVAPGTKVYAVKVLDAQGSGYFSDIICGIDWVTANAAALGIRVANMSLGGLGDYSSCAQEPLHQAVCNSTAAGVVYTVAAGNDGWNWGAEPPDVPAWFPEVLTVTAVSDSDGEPGATGGAPACRPGETDDRRASFSNHSTAAADNGHTVAAPGVCVLSTLPGGGYGTMSGTSMAAPHVAGLVALCMGESGASGPCAGLDPAEVVQKVRADAESHATAANGFNGDPLHPLGGRWYGYLASAAASTGTTLAAPPPTPAAPTPPAAAPAPRVPTCTVRRVVRRHRHVVVRRTRVGKRKRSVRIHRHVRRIRVCV